VPELGYQAMYKLKSMKLFTLIPQQGWRHILDIKDLFMAKIASNPEGNRVYVIGGAKDSKSKHTVDSLSVYNISAESINHQHLSCMNDARASFGCLYVPRHNSQIFVTGGYINGKLSQRCERYSIQTDTWSALPDLNEAKASSSLCLLNDRYLYCFGGLSRNTQGQAYLTNTIEMLDLLQPNPQWVKLPSSIPFSGCDIGCVPISRDSILVFGGWNKTAQKGVYLFQRKNVQINSSNLHSAE
jgi:N-acetylneuraminic acid mutarotase